MIRIELIHEFAIENSIKIQIAELLKRCFPDENFYGRTYFKQHPHSRLLLIKENQLIGQLGLDYRVMRLNGEAVHVLGIIDLAVFPEYQRQGYASKLIHHLTVLSLNWSHNLDFLLLYAENVAFYEKFGFSPFPQHVEWLAIDEHVNYGLMKEYIHQGLMYKPISRGSFPENSKLDLLGYFY